MRRAALLCACVSALALPGGAAAQSLPPATTPASLSFCELFASQPGASGAAPALEEKKAKTRFCNLFLRGGESDQSTRRALVWEMIANRNPSPLASTITQLCASAVARTEFEQRGLATWPDFDQIKESSAGKFITSPSHWPDYSKKIADAGVSGAAPLDSSVFPAPRTSALSSKPYVTLPNRMLARLCLSAKVAEMPSFQNMSSEGRRSVMEEVWDSEGFYFGLSEMFSISYDLRERGVGTILAGVQVHLAKSLSAVIIGIADIGKWLFGIIFVIALLHGGWKVISRKAEVGSALQLLIGTTVAGVLFFILMARVPLPPPAPGGSGGVGTYAALQAGGSETLRISAIVGGLADWLTGEFKDAACGSASGGGMRGAWAASGLVDATAEGALKGLCDKLTHLPSEILIMGAETSMGLMLTPIRTSRNEAYTGKERKTKDIFSDLTFGLDKLLGLLVGLIAGLTVLILWVLSALTLMAIWLEGFFIMIYGVFMLAFGAWDNTRDKALAYIWNLLGWAFRLAIAGCVFVSLFLGLRAGIVSIPFMGHYIKQSSAEYDIVSFLLYCLLEIIVSLVSLMMMTTVSNGIGRMIGSTSAMAERLTTQAQATAALGMSKMTAAVGASAAVAAAPAIASGKMAAGAAAAGAAAKHAGGSFLSGAGQNVSSALKNKFTKLTNIGGAGKP